ncbi:hypothetical protein Esti_002280 [Eimeria stiedai]
MDTPSNYASGHFESRTRLRSRNSHESFVNSLHSASGESVKGVDGGERSSNMNMRLSDDGLYIDAANPPTSPAFMRLLSQQSQRSPSHSSRSPSVTSQISSKRRVASPKVAARTWLSSDQESPSVSASNSRTHASNRTTETWADKADVFGSEQHTVLIRTRGRPGRPKSRDAFKATRRRSSSRHTHKSHKKEREKEETFQSKRQKEGAQLRSVESPRTPPRSPSRTPQLVMSPRRFPPPTFEKILLGLKDKDFDSGSEEPDVFGSRDVVPRRHRAVEQDNCISVSVAPQRPSRVHSPTMDSTSSRESAEFFAKDQNQSSREEVIPEHYLYIPPLRAVASREEKRPVPGLHQASDDEGQISVRGERRHIATLFSLDAAESHAQKTRLEEQLKATIPFRLAEMNEPSFAGGENLDCPPGKSKRRQPSKVLETIVREHDWKLPELVTETEEQVAQRQRTLREEQCPALSDQDEASAAPESELKCDQFVKSDSLFPMSELSPKEEDADFNGYLGNEYEDDNVDERCSQRSAIDEITEIPGAFDAIWGRSDSKKKPLEHKESGTSSSDDEDNQHAFGQNTLNCMAAFVSMQPASPEGEETRDESSDAAYEEEVLNISKSDAGSKTASSPASSLVLDGKAGGVALLRLGDPAEWEVRYSTADGFLSSPDHSPMHCKVESSAPTQPKKAISGEEVSVDLKEDAEEDSGQESSNQLPAEPLLSTGFSRDVSGGQTRMSSYISGFSSEELYGSTRDPSGLHVNAASKTALQITNEPRLGAALDLRLASVPSFQGEAAVNCNMKTSGCTLPSSSTRRLALRKRPRILTEESNLTDCDAHPPPPERQAYEGQTDASTGAANPSLVSTLTDGPEMYSLLKFRTPGAHQKGERSHAGAGTNVTAANDSAWVEIIPSIRNADRAMPSALDRFKPVAASADCDAWAEEGTTSLHAVEDGASNGQHTDRRGSESLCEIDLSEPLKLSEKETAPHRHSPPPPSRSVELFRLISGATSWCAYGPSVHAVIVGTMLLALWIVLAVLYLFDGNHGLRFFVVCAVALSFVVSLCLGAIHLTSAVFTWKALKYAVDSDMRELLFSSLTRLRPAPDARDPSIEGLRERGRYLGLACDHFIELTTQASPSLEVTRMIGMRFIVAHCFVGLVGVGLIAILGFSIESEASLLVALWSLSDAIATAAAALYSVLLLVLSYWLATTPTAAVVQRAVERHAAIQYLWTLTFADFLVENGAATAKSAEALWVHRQEDRTTRCSPYLISLKNSLFKQDKSLLTIRVHEIPSSLKANYMTARTVWQLPSGTASNNCKGLHAGQRALLTLGSAAPQPTEGSQGATARLFLKLLWCGNGIGPEELHLPIDFDSLICESTAPGRIPTCPGSFALGQHGSEAVGSQSPLEVIRLLLGLLKGDTARSFMKSHTRRYLSKPIPLSSASCEFSVTLRVPLDAIRLTSWSPCGPQRRSKKTGATTLQQICLQGQDEGLAPPFTASGVSIHQEIKTEASIEGATNARVGPWVVQSLCLPQPTFPAELLKGKRRLNGPVAAANAASTSDSGPCRRQGACEEFALLTLLFGSEEQREEFNGCLEQLLCV